MHPRGANHCHPRREANGRSIEPVRLCSGVRMQELQKTSETVSSVRMQELHWAPPPPVMSLGLMGSEQCLAIIYERLQ